MVYWTLGLIDRQNHYHPHESELFATKIHRLFVTPEETWGEEFRDLWQHNRELTLRLLVELHDSRAPRQRDVECKRIEQWLGHLDQLAAD